MFSSTGKKALQTITMFYATFWIYWDGDKDLLLEYTRDFLHAISGHFYLHFKFPGRL